MIACSKLFFRPNAPLFSPHLYGYKSKFLELGSNCHGLMTHSCLCAQVVGPKKIKLAEAEEELNKTMAMLNAKRAELAAVEKRLADLKATFQEMTEKKAKLEMQVS